MPKGPKGEKIPADVVGAAINVARIATGALTKDVDETKEHHRKGGLKGGKARAEKLTAEQRSMIAKKAARKRWG